MRKIRIQRNVYGKSVRFSIPIARIGTSKTSKSCTIYFLFTHTLNSHHSHHRWSFCKSKQQRGRLAATNRGDQREEQHHLLRVFTGRSSGITRFLTLKTLCSGDLCILFLYRPLRVPCQLFNHHFVTN
ncbi:hypothetical protein NE237_025821 [Protea cynaroides]|uniref:Uncharacterized protein n=1 Tax=Protea cynaroides TaxID=273540 RepID=A0A9Q0H3R4_9MAGN|nr:hypothetical protein NE237_025821 [Protea cynaroides]